MNKQTLMPTLNAKYGVIVNSFETFWQFKGLQVSLNVAI